MERVKKTPSIGIVLANIILILSLAFNSQILLFMALLAWIAGLIWLLIQNKNESKFKTVLYSVLAACVVIVALFVAGI